MKVLEVIDGWFAWLFHWPLKLLCGITGKDNFLFAKGAIIVGFMLQSFLSVHMVLMGHASGLSAGFDLADFILLVGSPCWIRIEWVRQKERPAEEVVTLTYNRIEQVIRVGLVLFMLILGLFVVPGLILDPLAIPFFIVLSPFAWCGISLYWLHDVHPRRKSWTRQGLESTVRAIKGLRPTPRVNPRPIGV